MRSQIISALILINALLTTNVLGDYIIDQHWEKPGSPHNEEGRSILNQSPLGQEFTPEADIITVVEIAIDDVDLPSETVSITTKIRDNTITGPIVASATLTLESPSDVVNWWHFDFGEEIVVTAGNRYVIDVSIPMGSARWSWQAWEDSDGIGIPGRRIVSGNYLSETDNLAFGFRTYTVPEPATLFLFGLGGLGLLRKRRA